MSVTTEIENKLESLEMKAEQYLKNSKKYYIYGLLYLFQIKEKKLYKSIDPDFRKYLKIRWGMKKSTLYNHIKILKTFLPSMDFQKELPDFKRLEQAYPVVKALPEKVDEVYHMALVNSDEDFHNNLRELQNRIATDVCDHPMEKRIKVSYIICKKCGKTLERYESEIDL